MKSSGEGGGMPLGRGGPSPAPPSGRHGIGSGGLGLPSDLSVPPEDLSADKLLATAPRVKLGERSFPALAGIPLLARLGQGGMGTVYYGVHPRLKREVAVKVLPFMLAEQEPGLIPRFYREAQIAAQVESPHLVGVLDVNEEQGLFFIIMEFVAGLSAGAYLKRMKEMGKTGVEEAVALDICIGAARGLAAAHEKGVVHRDVKPDNVLIPKGEGHQRWVFGAAKLSDLGLARAEWTGHSLTGTQAALGTPGFLAPEQARDAKSAGKPADVFGLGATLYALLSGRAPFQGSSAFEVMMNTMQQPHAPVAQFCPDLSARSSALIERCLAKAPDDRFADAMALLEALRECRAKLGEPGDTLLAPGAAARPAPAAERPAPSSALVSVLGATPPTMPRTMAGVTTPAGPQPAPSSMTGTGAPPAAGRGGKKSRAVLAAAALAALLAGGAYWAQSRFEGLMAQGRQAAARRRWPEAQAAFQRALAMPVFWSELDARAALDEARRGETYDGRLEEARGLLQAGRWVAAEAAFGRALEVPGYSQSAEARAGRQKAGHGQAYQEALSEGRRFAGQEDWARAETAFEAALKIPGHAEDALARTELKRAREGKTYERALEKAHQEAKAQRWAAMEQLLKKIQTITRYRYDPKVQQLLKTAANGQTFEKRLREARAYLQQANWSSAEAAFVEAGKIAGYAQSEISRTSQDAAFHGQAFAKAMGEGQRQLGARQWVLAQAAFRQALAVEGYAKDAQASASRQAAQNGQQFTEARADGEALLQKKKWGPAEKAWVKALAVPGYEKDERARAALKSARNGLAFEKAMAEGGAHLDGKRWSEAIAAFQRALGVPGYGGNAQAKTKLARAQAERAKQRKRKNYIALLKQAQALRAKVPAGKRNAEAWAKVKRAAQEALGSGHSELSEAQELYGQAQRAEQSALNWIQSDRLVARARELAAKKRWAEADRTLANARRAVRRTDVAALKEQIRIGRARSEGRSYWKDDRKLLEYKGRTFVVGVRGTALKKWRLVTHTSQDRPFTTWWVTYQDQQVYTIYDLTNSKLLSYNILIMVNARDASLRETSDWVGEITPSRGKYRGRYIQIRQYDKRKGGSRMWYVKTFYTSVNILSERAVLASYPWGNKVRFSVKSHEVSDKMVKRIVKDYDLYYARKRR